MKKPAVDLLDSTDDDEEDAEMRCLKEDGAASQRMSRLGKIRRYTHGISSRVNSRIKGLSSRFNSRVRQLRERRPKTALKKVTQHLSGKLKRQLAWQSLEADEQLNAMRLQYSSRPLSAVFAHPCYRCCLSFAALAALVLLLQSYSSLLASSAVLHFRHYRLLPDVQTRLVAFGMGCEGMGCGASLSQVPLAHAPHSVISGGNALISHDRVFAANFFYVVAPPGALPSFVVEGSDDGKSWSRIWPGAGPWGENEEEEEEVRPVVALNSVDDVRWFTAEACGNATSLGVECREGRLLRKDLHLYWQHHAAFFKDAQLLVAVVLASLLGRPQFARPLVLGSTFAYAAAALAIGASKLELGELATEWAQALGALTFALGTLCSEKRLFFYLSLGLSVSLALVGSRGLLCQLSTLGRLTCREGYLWQAEMALSFLFALMAVTVRCTQRRPAAERRPARFPPPGVSFLGAEGTPAPQELLAFAVIRSIFGMEERGYRRAAHALLRKVVSERKKSSARSGALMAFEGGLVVKSMTAVEASTLLAILRSYLFYLETRGGAKTLLPRFYGAYVHVNWLGRQTFFVVMANVFPELPPSVLKTMERFDLKGSSDDRTRRSETSELMDFDVLQADRKLVPVDEAKGAELLLQLQEDVKFLQAQHMPAGLLDYEALPESIGLMDYSLLVGLVPKGTPNGIDVRDERAVRRKGSDGEVRWERECREATAVVGVIDILQFWTHGKRAARLLKKGLGRENDLDGEYHGEILDTVEPDLYSARFLSFLQELFREGSWVESLPRMCGGDWGRVAALQICQLPRPVRLEAQERQRAAVSERRERFALG